MRILYTILIICLMISSSGCSIRYEKYQSEFIGLFDTVTVIIGYAKSEADFNLYADTIYNRMKELNNLYDIYNEYEGINNIYTINQNAGISPVEVSDDIINMLMLAKNAYEITNGTVNISMGSVLKIWHDYRKTGVENEEIAEVPSMDMLREAAKITNFDDVVIDVENNTVYLKKQGMSLDVGAVAKGYAAEQAVKSAQNVGAVSIILNAGGNITSIGKPMDNVRSRWGIGIQNPNLGINGTQHILDTVYVNDSTISCSGDYQRFYIVDGQRYNHIIDTETLMPANLYKTVAVVHESSSMADILSTALFIMPLEDGKTLAEKTGAEVLWVFQDDSWKATDGYEKISKSMSNYSAVD